MHDRLVKQPGIEEVERFSVGGHKQHWSHKEVLDIGSGDDPVPGADTLDRMENFDPDIHQDLTELPLPIDDDRYDLIIMKDVLEHLPTAAEYLDRLFSELERILKPHGSIYIRVPYYKGAEAAGDIQHARNGYSSQFHLEYVNTDLEVTSNWIVFAKGRKFLLFNKLIEPVANAAPDIWEHTPLASWFPAMNLEMELRHG